ncbi:MAG: 30S ribosomal protein S12 methylthiotransferase RimO [Butyribacter sp.]|nr:30S ribosomal protein S12 methylthiotransferase RimO [bacterium]MDY3855184.1 30S ribosomal protein S12 methylthiotransferase RimO [Butyribacter sp.]
MKIYFVSLGCDKNLVDSEMMITDLKKAGHTIIDDETMADVIVVNTCCFIGDAKEESINALLSMAEYKENANCKLLIATGCLAQRYHKEIAEEIPEVDVIIGTMGYESLVNAIEEGLAKKGEVTEHLESIDYLPTPSVERDSMTGGYFAYLKIAEGCDKHCTYCIIPKVRGKYRSVPMENLLAQAKHLVENGAKELILVAQETTLYGQDLYGKKSLPKLLEELSKIEDLKWIRILYCYPEEITEELVDAIKRLPKVCHYLDMPIQHASDSILKKMGRRTNQQEIVQIVEKLRSEIPDIALRTTLITGFPGETQDDFEQLKRFVSKMQFDRLGVFPYSQEEDTPAADLPEQIAEEVKESRKDEIMQIQQEIAFEKSKACIGRKLDVMIEGNLPDEGVYIARTYMDAPDVDGYVFVESDWNLMSGDFITVEIVGADGYDLIGTVAEEE